MTEEQGTPATWSVQVKEFVFKPEGVAWATRQRNVEKKTVHVSTSRANRRMKRIEVEWMGKGRMAGASAPLLLWAVH